MNRDAINAPHPNQRRIMPRHAAKATLAALSIFALGALGGCSSGTEEESTDEAPVEETSAPAPAGDDGAAEDPAADDEAPEEAPASDVTRYAVGDTFTSGDQVLGVFDVTYMGLAEFGSLDDGDITCYAVLVEATLTEMPTVDLDPQFGGVTVEALDASGNELAASFGNECDDSMLAENGYPTEFDVEWVEGVPTAFTTAKLTVAVADTDSVDSVNIDSLGGYVLDFEVVGTW
ncbi:hypothetical protein [Demequina aurantiaca]|uniref:hypothetical protein n=1 Tax=Demequina aurantiaca TaxID=676200 RepID=UPI003D355470